MFKSVNGTSKFSQILKDTKIAQLQASIGDNILEANKAFPTHQIIEAPASSFSRRDFGLKMRIPKKIKTRRIIVNDLDNKYGLPNFETTNGSYFKKLRFKELGIPVRATRSNRNSQLLSDDDTKNKRFMNPLLPQNEDVSSQTIAELLHLKNQSLNSTKFVKDIKPELRKLRKPFFTWLAKNHPDCLNKKIEVEHFHQFVKETRPQLFNNDKNFIPSTYLEKLSGTAGLSYNLKGRLFQTPYGPKTSRVVPARVVSKSMSPKCAVGGFIANIPNSSAHHSYIDKLSVQNRAIENGKFAREFEVPVVVTSANLLLDDHRLSLRAEQTKPRIRETPKRANSKVSSSMLSNLTSLLHPTLKTK